VPQSTTNEPCLMGIDEAGRGPVLGPMVYGTCYCPISQKDILATIGFADSKTLSEEQRDGLFEKLKNANDTLGWIVDILSPNYISNSMLKRSKYNLNQLSHDTAIGLIHKVLDSGVDLKEVYVDTVGDPASYQNKLKTVFPNLEIVVSKKADSLFPIVSAASICAKVARDKAVKEWKFIEGLELSEMEYGSGYPGDPKTKNFLTKAFDPVFGFPQFVRFGWSTASTIIDDKAIAVHWDDDDDDEKVGRKKEKKEDLKNVPSITNFFQSSRSNTSASVVPELTVHRFLTERCLLQTTELFD
jgi:ribonuclease H2 subunit A